MDREKSCKLMLEFLEFVQTKRNQNYYIMKFKKCIDSGKNEHSLHWEGDITQTKFNHDIIVWHKGGPKYYMRHENLNKNKYKKYDEIVLNDESIIKTIESNDYNIYCKSFNQI